MANQNNTPFFQGIRIRNAGMVLLNNYIPMLFERLKLTEARQFVSESAQLQAMHYLQFVTTGRSHTEEYDLILNKILCGVIPTHPVINGIDISKEEIDLIEGMIQAVIGHWSAIGQSSVEGFRDKWLVRDGLMVETPERWELTVDRRAYDVLINQSPFSFSIIHFPWMTKPLHVYWLS